MRGLLPGLKGRTIHATATTNGPAVDVCHATKRVLDRVRQIERGLSPVPHLPIELSTRSLVLYGWTEERLAQVLEDWAVVKLGKFSAFPAQVVQLTQGGKTSNKGLVMQENEKTQQKLLDLQREEDLPEPEEVVRSGRINAFGDYIAAHPINFGEVEREVTRPTVYDAAEELPEEEEPLFGREA